MIPKTAFIIIIAVMSIAFLSVPVSAVTWTAVGDKWISNTYDYWTVEKWNATGNHNWTAPTGVTNVTYLIVAGGGGGASGGGGAGGLLYATGYSVTEGTKYNITVGTGGAGGRGGMDTDGQNGTNSSFSSLQANRGAGAPNDELAGYDGGSGSGGGASGSTNYHPGNSTPVGQGYAGGWTGLTSAPYPAGGGGGAGGIGGNGSGSSGGAGGAGLQYNITGELLYYAGGGGGSGASIASGTGGTGGSGVGGNGAYNNVNGVCGVNETGSGGGGTGQTGYAGCGGSGVVVIRYYNSSLVSQINATFTANNTAGYSPVSVQFTDTSTNSPTGWNWSYRNVTGNNVTTIFSYSQNASKVFNVPGNYSISLFAYNNVSNATSAQTTFINVTPMTVSFSANTTSGENNVSVQFTDLTTGNPTGWNWTYRNITGSNTTVLFSTIKNATHIFTPGNYTIVLHASNSGENVSSTQTTYINVSDTLPPSNIVVSIPPTIMCTAITWNWTNPADPDYAGSLSMINGVLESNITPAQSSRTWTNLSQNTSYTWGVQAFDNVPNFNSTIVNRTRTTPWCTFAVDFSATPLTGNYTLPVAFTVSYSASPPASMEWSWGDGTPNTTTTSLTVSHSYTYSGSFSPTVTAANATGTSYAVTKTNYINVYAPVVNTTYESSRAPPQLVQFRVHTWAGTPLSNAVVSIQGINTTAGSFDWLSTLLGIPLGEAPIQNTFMQGTTDSLGNIEFMMVPTTKYNITTTLAGYTFPSMYITPHDERYDIVPNLLDGEGYTNPLLTNISKPSITITPYYISNTNQGINVSYSDASGISLGGYVNITQNNATLLQSHLITTTAFNLTQNVTVPVGGTSLHVSVRATNTTGNVSKDYGVEFRGPPVTSGGFDPQILVWISLGMIILMGLMAGALEAPQVSVITCIVAFIFYGIGWFDPVVNSVGADKFVGLLVFATIIAVFWNFRKGKLEETGR